MSKKISRSILVSQGPDEVYDFLAIPSNHATFVPNLESLDTDPPGSEWEVGTTATGQRKVMLGQHVTETATLVEKVPGRRIVWDVDVMGAGGRGTWEMEPGEDGAIVTLSSEFEQNAMMRLFSLLGLGDLDSEIAKVLESLQARLNEIGKYTSDHAARSGL